LPVELREAATQRVLGIGLHVSVGADDEKPCPLEETGHVLQQVERRRVSPLKIVEDDDQRILDGAQQARDRLEETNALLLRAQPLGLGLDCPVELGDDGGDDGRALPRGPKERSGFERPSVLCEDLVPRGVRRSALALVAGSHAQSRSLGSSERRHLPHEPGLSDPRLSGEHGHGAVAVGGRSDQAAQCRQLALSPDQGCCGR
jgi:hypothetical protein